MIAMKTNFLCFAVGSLAVHLLSASAQLSGQSGAMGGPPRAPNFSGSMAKLFGDNSAFTAALELQSKGGPTDEMMTVPGKLAFDHGKSRFEMDMSEMQGAKMPPGTGAQMKAMGIEKVVSISRPDKKATYMVYPGLQSYLELTMKDSKADETPEDFKLEITELGREKVEGQSCVKK